VATSIRVFLLGGLLLAGIASRAVWPAPTVEAKVPGGGLTLQVDGAGEAAPVAYQIQPSQTVARFKIDEVLRGTSNTVIGTTNQVSGQITVDPRAPASAQVGTILVDARTLVTDDPQRNRMLSQFILGSEQNQYIAFSPTSFTGLPTTTAVGSSYQFQITGVLTVMGAVHPVTFDANVTPVSPTELRGSASTTINYPDFAIRIPQVPLVANVSDQVQLDIAFYATSTVQ
jgi:polyisoprenoid-binding protein YceI